MATPTTLTICGEPDQAGRPDARRGRHAADTPAHPAISPGLGACLGRRLWITRRRVGGWDRGSTSKPRGSPGQGSGQVRSDIRSRRAGQAAAPLRLRIQRRQPSLLSDRLPTHQFAVFVPNRRTSLRRHGHRQRSRTRTASRPAHPQENAEIDVAHTFCTVGAFPPQFAIEAIHVLGRVEQRFEGKRCCDRVQPEGALVLTGV
jgi:hypothetical protein